MDEPNRILDSMAWDTVSTDRKTELERVRSFDCGCKSNEGRPCCTSFEPDAILSIRLDMQELTESKRESCSMPPSSE